MFDYIDNNDALHALLTDIQDSAWVVLDTEFIREKTYYPRLCLIQIATEKRLACIDPLMIDDLAPFFTWLHDENRLKILHAATQDIEIIYHLSGQVPKPIFDSQIAAAVLGMGDQMGYARLVEAMLNVQIDKSQSRTDWSRRPLRQAQLSYAIDDVRYLRDVYPLLHKQLKSLGRADWLHKPFAKLSDPATYDVDVRTCWKKVKNLQILKPQQLSILREIAAWREESALRKNIPKRWILSDEILVDMARMYPHELKDFENIRGLKTEIINRHGKKWLEMIKTGANLPRDQWPELPRRKKLTGEASIVVDLLMVALNQQAQAHNISPQMLATRPQVEKMVSEGRTHLSEDWRGSLLNDVFAELLSGKASLQIQGQKVVTRH